MLTKYISTFAIMYTIILIHRNTNTRYYDTPLASLQTIYKQYIAVHSDVKIHITAVVDIPRCGDNRALIIIYKQYYDVNHTAKLINSQL